MFLLVLIMITFSVVFFGIIADNKVNLVLKSNQLQSSTEILNLLRFQDETGKSTLELVGQIYDPASEVLKRDGQYLRNHIEKSLQFLPKEYNTHWQYYFIDQNNQLIPSLPSFYTSDQFEILEEQQIAIPVKQSSINFKLIKIKFIGGGV